MDIALLGSLERGAAGPDASIESSKGGDEKGPRFEQVYSEGEATVQSPSGDDAPSEAPGTVVNVQGREETDKTSSATESGEEGAAQVDPSGASEVKGGEQALAALAAAPGAGQSALQAGQGLGREASALSGGPEGRARNFSEAPPSGLVGNDRAVANGVARQIETGEAQDVAQAQNAKGAPAAGAVFEAAPEARAAATEKTGGAAGQVGAQPPSSQTVAVGGEAEASAELSADVPAEAASPREAKGEAPSEAKGQGGVVDRAAAAAPAAADPSAKASAATLSAEEAAVASGRIGGEASPIAATAAGLEAAADGAADESAPGSDRREGREARSGDRGAAEGRVGPTAPDGDAYSFSGGSGGDQNGGQNGAAGGDKAAQAVLGAGGFAPGGETGFADAVLEASPLQAGSTLTPTARADAAIAAQQAAQAGRGGAVAEQIGAAILSRGDDRRIFLQLDPQELGRVSIELTFADDALSISVRAERPEALELMRRNAADLERQLQEAGLDFDTLSFSGEDAAEGGFSDDRSGGATRDGFAYRGEARLGATTELNSPLQSAPPRPAESWSNGVDLRV